MAVAGMLLDVAPGLAAALPAHIDDLHRDIEEPVGLIALTSARAERSRPPPGGVPATISISRSGFQIMAVRRDAIEPSTSRQSADLVAHELFEMRPVNAVAAGRRRIRDRQTA